MTKKKKTKHTKTTSKNTTNTVEEKELQEDAVDKFTLMPELEELVKKNPNRNIGCGG